MKRDFLKTLNVEKPCAENWDEMRGDDKMRFCKHCAETVNNISEMTVREIEKLAAKSHGRLCVRYIRNADKRIITKNTPQNFTPTNKRISQFAAGIFGAALSVSGVAAQTQTDANSNANQSRIESRINANQQNASGIGSIKGVVTDEQGAVIPNVTVILSDTQNNQINQIVTNEYGAYNFDNVPNGVHQLEANASGFKKNIITEIKIKSEGIDVPILLSVSGEFVSMGVVAMPSKIQQWLSHDDRKPESSEIEPAGLSEDASDFLDAVTGGEITDIKESLKNKNLIHSKIYNGNEILFYANDAKTAKFLIKRKADVNARNTNGETALMKINDVETINILIKAGADVNATSNFGDTPLMFAMDYAESEKVNLLIKEGASVNNSNVDGRTALMFAAYNGDLEIVKLLVDSGASVNSRDNEGKSVLKYALEAESKEIIEYLKNIGAVE